MVNVVLLTTKKARVVALASAARMDAEAGRRTCGRECLAVRRRLTFCVRGTSITADQSLLRNNDLASWAPFSYFGRLHSPGCMAYVMGSKIPAHTASSPTSDLLAW